jgi:hypothetical protein
MENWKPVFLLNETPSNKDANDGSHRRLKNFFIGVTVKKNPAKK